LTAVVFGPKAQKDSQKHHRKVKKIGFPGFHVSKMSKYLENPNLPPSKSPA
jgi:hypothetical protein